MSMRLAAHCGLGSRARTTAFWVYVAVFVTGLWLSPIVPLGDYGYHLALSGILRRMVVPGPERAIFETHLVGYNSLFQVLVAALALVMPVARAGLVVMSATYVIFAWGAVALVRACRRPLPRAFVALPLLSSVPFAWGFTNFNLAMSIQLFVLAHVVGPPRGLRASLRTMVLALVGVWAHLFASAIAFLAMGVVVLVRAYRSRRRLLDAWPLAPAVCAALALRIAASHDPLQAESSFVKDQPATDKVKAVMEAGLLREDRLDAKCIFLAAAVPLLAFALPSRRRRGGDVAPWLLLVFFALYTFLPIDKWNASILYPRLVPLVVLGIAVAVPEGNRLAEALASHVLDAVAGIAALAFFAMRVAQLGDMRDLERVIQASPPNRLIAEVALDAHVPGMFYAWAGHLAPFYVATKGGDSAVGYAAKNYLPVRYRSGKPPYPLAPDSLAQATSSYDRNAPWARRFTLVLVHTNDGADVRPAFWPDRPARVTVVAHTGRWWMYDANAYFN